jgi:hypothetical protein
MKNLKTIFTLLASLTFSLAVSAIGGVTITSLIGHIEYAPILSGGIYSLSLVTSMQLPMLAYSSPAVFTEGLCEKVQTSLNDLMGNNAPESKRTPVGYLQAILSPTNRAGFSSIPIDQGNGKKRSARITYAQRGTEADITDTYNNGCTPEISKTPFEDIVSVDTPLSTLGISFSEDEMRKLCEADSAWMARVINSELNPFMTALNKRLITLQNANFGNFADGSNARKDRILINASGEAIYNGEVAILNDFEDIDAGSRPMLIGSGMLRDYTRLTDVGCCNSVGVDLGAGGDFDYFNDRHVGGILGNANDFIGLAPGNVQLVTYNKYKGAYRKENDVFSKGTIIDPVTGLELDMRWKYDDCNEVYTLTFSLWYMLYFLPANAFASSDDLEGVNYTLHYRGVNA